MPNCKPGDLAIITGTGKEDLDGKIVEVVETAITTPYYRGGFKVYVGSLITLTDTSKAWMVKALNHTFVAYRLQTREPVIFEIAPIDDCYLVPIRPSDEALDKVTKFEDDLAQKLKDNLIASRSSLQKQFDKAKVD